MLRTTLFSFVAAALVHALAVQIPLGSGPRWQDEGYPAMATLGGEDTSEWNLNNLPNPNTTDHLVFETVHSLLQHWPNTRMRSGHNIVPGIIPKGTLLYHGRPDEGLPTGPEWIATDPEHSYVFCRNMLDRSQEGGWLLTLMATRPLRIIYFDGSSAAKVRGGSADTQDLLIWGRTGEVFDDEPQRIQDLCEWGKNFGVDGFVRMEVDFEVVYCDFTSGISTVSFTKVASKWSGSSMVSSYELFETLNAGAWHNRFPGEARIQLDFPGLVSFYDTQLAPSLVGVRAGQERWDHRTQNISSKDLSALKSRLEAYLIRPDDVSSGVDWKTLIQVIVDRYAERLELTHYLLNSSVTDVNDIVDLAKKAQTQLRIMLTPYLLFSVAPPSQSDKAELDWAIPIYELCATVHTQSMESQFDSMTDSEKTLLQAVRGTSREICRVVTKMWAAGAYAGIDPVLNTKEFPDISEVTRLREAWAGELERLMAWLDWSEWVKCKPGCGFEEMCYLPTWPVGFPWLSDSIPSPLPPDDYPLQQRKLTSAELRTMVMRRLADDVSNIIKPGPDEWIRPQPKCIRRIKPYAF